MLLQDLERKTKEWCSNHEPNPEDDIFREMNGSVSDIGPWEWFHIGWRFIDCNFVSPHYADY